MTTAVEESIAHLDFEPGAPCACKCDDAVRPCDDIAVTRALLRLVPHGCGGALYSTWNPLCAKHAAMARNGTLKCGLCLTPGAFEVLEERPL